MPEQISPELHELIYSYRDYEAEVTFVELCWQRLTSSENGRVLDIGCGIGVHMRQFLQRGYECDGIDVDPEMLEYGRARFTAEGLELNASVADMRDFKATQSYGLAINMLASANLLLTNQEMVTHLRAVARALEPGGIYILEMFHPREYGFPSESPYNVWEIQTEDLYIECVLHFEREVLDPVSQCQRTKKRVAVTRDGETEVHLFPRTQRVYLFQEFKALVECAGGFELADCFGAFDIDCPLDNSRRSWRMIPILRRI